MTEFRRNLRPRMLFSVFSNRFFATSILIGMIPILLFPLIDSMVVRGGFNWFGHPLAVVILWVVVSAFVGLQFRVYRAVIDENSPREPVNLVSIRRDTLVSMPIIAVCFSAPTILTVGLGVQPPTPWRLLTGSTVTSISDVSALQFGYVSTLLVGMYVFPATMGAIADGDSVEVSSVGGLLVVALSSHTYAAHWLVAVAVGIPGFVLLLVWTVFVFATIFFYPVNVLVLVPVGLLLATAIVALLSYIAATGYAKSRATSGDPRLSRS